MFINVLIVVYSDKNAIIDNMKQQFIHKMKDE